MKNTQSMLKTGKLNEIRGEILQNRGNKFFYETGEK